MPVWGEQVLLCKRNIEPRKGKWTLPAGFMELGETTAEGAARETDEEAGAQIELLDLFSVMNVVRVGQVHLFYRATLLSDRFNPGHETQEARLFVTTGILGGYTTFSAFSLDAMLLYERGEMLTALIYVVGSVVLSILGLAFGLYAVRMLT